MRSGTLGLGWHARAHQLAGARLGVLSQVLGVLRQVRAVCTPHAALGLIFWTSVSATCHRSTASPHWRSTPCQPPCHLLQPACNSVAQRGLPAPLSAVPHRRTAKHAKVTACPMHASCAERTRGVVVDRAADVLGVARGAERGLQRVAHVPEGGRVAGALVGGLPRSPARDGVRQQVLDARACRSTTIIVNKSSYCHCVGCLSKLGRHNAGQSCRHCLPLP